MSVTPTQLVETASGQRLDAELHDCLGFGDLLDAESAWTPARYTMIKRLHEGGIPRKQWPQHWHWNWVQKLLSRGEFDIGGALSVHRLMGIHGADAWQGLVLCTAIGHQTRLLKEGRDLLYVDYLESAPWNLKVDLLGQESRYRGAGQQLVELSLRLSEALGLRGRLGLHALPQADRFYGRCGFTDLGEDSDYQGLHYFEMNEQHAQDFLQARRKTK